MFEAVYVGLVAVVLVLAGLLWQARRPVEPPTVIVQMPEPVAPKPEPLAKKKLELVKARFLDSNEVDVHGEERLDAAQRRPVVVRHGNKYMCARQDDAGAWIYRQVEF